MSENELNIEEIRAKCNQTLDYLITEFFNSYSETKKHVDEFVKNIKENEEKKQAKYNNDLLLKIMYAVKVGLNFFAIHALNIEHEFLDFSSFKESVTQVKVEIDQNSPSMKTMRIDEGNVKALQNIKLLINQDDKIALMFYKKFMLEIADKRLPLIETLYKFIEEMKLPFYSSKEDRQIFYDLKGEKRYSINHVCENTISDIYYGRANNLDKVRGR